ncbi:MAG: TetR/AcrR family transcriptional regulator [Clostridia bacterium]|nr:TetR/AcrR family transcriptional regulator [Clostridia bacterium]
MRKQDELRCILIDGTIRVISREGLDGASTKQIGLATSINEAYIYRCFKNKEDMLAKTFASLDDELIEKAMQSVSVMYEDGIEYETRCWIFFSTVWRFLLGNRDKCLAYIRYYYSPYFQRYSAEEHKEKYIPLVDKFRDAFHEQANTWMIFNHILTTMLDFSVKVFDGAVPDNDDTAEHVFRLIYCSIRQYFKKRSVECYEKGI